jgi:hypothetical protein
MTEHVQLDGQFATAPWPVDVAVSLLHDPAAWGYWWPGHPDNQRPNRHADFNQLALQVTAYHRHLPGSAWSNPLRDEDLRQTFASYSTQDLLDAVFLAARGDRFNYGLICRLEPQLRLILQEVVRRVQSEDPPHFEVTSARNENP